MSKLVLLSVAHSKVAPGVVSETAQLQEYMVSLRATLAAFRSLAGAYEVEMLDAGPLTPGEYSVEKVARVNGCMPALAVEIHCNGSSDPHANYAEVIYHPSSPIFGAKAAKAVCDSLAAGYAPTHGSWHVKGPRANSIEQDLHWDFFLSKTKVPAIIVEGLFMSNPEQAAWLANGGQETYGLLVADGIRKFLDSLP